MEKSYSMEYIYTLLNTITIGRTVSIIIVSVTFWLLPKAKIVYYRDCVIALSSVQQLIVTRNDDKNENPTK